MAVGVTRTGSAMIAGHFGFAAGVKAKAPAVPLWALMLACQWLDVIFVVLFFAHIEGLQSIPGAANGAYGAAIIQADYSHSLVGALPLSIVFGGAAGLRYGRANGLILGTVAMSHWILDLIMHRGDMPILPRGIGIPFRLGFGLWRYPMWSALLEFAFVVCGALLYWRAARRLTSGEGVVRRRANLCGLAMLASGIATLALNFFGF